ncbi:MAG: ATP synthase F1 subunit epsilon [Bacteroidota bacterium]|jgi:F-type H+-transporting ATPase subunit epsilon
MMHLDILTPDKALFSGEVTSVVLPGSKGQFEVLKNHAAIVSSLDKGTVKVKTVEGNTETFEVSGGVVEVLDNKITVLA